MCHIIVFFKLCFYFFTISMGLTMYLGECRCRWKHKEDPGSPGAGVMDGCVLTIKRGSSGVATVTAQPCLQTLILGSN